MWKKSYRRRNRRTNKGRRIKRKAGTSIVRVKRSFGFPDVYSCKFRYNRLYKCNNVTGLLSTFYDAYNANGPYDPLVALGGLSPPYWVNLSNVYNYCLTTYCKITVNFVNQSSSNAFVCLAMSDETLSSYDTADIGAARYSKRGSIGSVNGNNVKTLSMGMSMEKLLGEKYQQADDAVYCATNTTPAHGAYCVLAGQSVDATTCNMSADVTIIYYVTFKDIIEQTQ